MGILDKSSGLRIRSCDLNKELCRSLGYSYLVSECQLWSDSGWYDPGGNLIMELPDYINDPVEGHKMLGLIYGLGLGWTSQINPHVIRGVGLDYKWSCMVCGESYSGKHMYNGPFTSRGFGETFLESLVAVYYGWDKRIEEVWVI